MQTKDYVIAGAVLAFFGAFLAVPGLMDGFISFTRANPYSSSFLKFALLATFGECVGLRIACGVYNRPGFGILPKAFVWGLLGLAIKLAFTVFIKGTPFALAEIGLPITTASLAEGSFGVRLVTAFCSSVCINTIFAPVLMILHKMTDLHIARTGGTIAGLFSPFAAGEIMASIDWRVMWGFVLKKTIPLFWFPAHTITFLLPGHFQVLFAAILGIVLGVFLAVAGRRKAQAVAS